MKEAMPVTETEYDEESAEYYDDIYEDAVRTGIYNTTRFDVVYDAVIDYLDIHKKRTSVNVLEVGCGTGELGRRIVIAGHNYHGFDFSSNALKAHSLTTHDKIWCGDAYDFETWCHLPFDTVVAVEVFEHLDDLRILDFVPSGTHVVFSVPDFPGRSHVRIYPNKKSIRAYYKDFLDIRAARQIRTQKEKSIFVCDAVKI